MDYMDKLCTIFTEWCEKNKIEPDSADSILAWGNINQKQEKWLKKFVRLWEKADAK